MNKILVAPDSFKGNLTALEVADNIEKGILSVLPEVEVIKVPMADGGEGTVQSLVDATKGKLIYKEVTGPIGEAVQAQFGILGDGKRAVIEMATASGLPLVPLDKRDPTKTTTYGTGELIKAALDQGVEELIIGIGGSATNDGGVGMAQALGISFLDKDGNEVGFGGGELAKIESIDLSGFDSRVNEIDIKVACDVTNPLYGPNGAAYIYGPQKGANSKMVKELDNNLRHFAAIVARELNKNVQNISGAGAAGGLGAGLVAFLGAQLKSGIEIVLEANNFVDKLAGVDLVITGEGQLDNQTVNGKTPIGVARVAKKYNIPVIAIAGNVVDNVDKKVEGEIDAVFSTNQQLIPLEEAMEKAPIWLQMISRQIMKTFKIKF
ncbi:glycerate kinase [Orenia metallireducens]|uniref:Glycerate kinase n=1 Tax=Orenia metallireducens TaxID=1413210 RepID=A0A1C0A8L1_9FIRM|nr:glycerate kinase [Orenia metallireducens]OCL26586.1 glycerate kinase [Orenia metallireducens]